MAESHWADGESELMPFVLHGVDVESHHTPFEMLCCQLCGKYTARGSVFCADSLK